MILIYLLATQIIYFAISNGKLLAHGTPEEIINEEIIREVYGLNSKIIKDPITQRPMIIPIGKCK